MLFRRGDGSSTMTAMDVARDAARGQDAGSAHVAILRMMEEKGAKGSGGDKEVVDVGGEGGGAKLWST